MDGGSGRPRLAGPPSFQLGPGSSAGVCTARQAGSRVLLFADSAILAPDPAVEGTNNGFVFLSNPLSSPRADIHMTPASQVESSVAEPAAARPVGSLVPARLPAPGQEGGGCGSMPRAGALWNKNRRVPSPLAPPSGAGGGASLGSSEWLAAGGRQNPVAWRRGSP